MNFFKKNTNTPVFLAFLLGSLSVPAMANTTSSADGVQDCRQAQRIAQDMMFSKQNGASIEDLKKMLARGSSVFTREEAERLTDLTIDMLENAYNTPVQHSLAQKYLASKDFSRATYVQCVDNKISKVIL